MKHKIKRTRLKFQKGIPWIIAAVAVLSANWASDALSDTFQLLLDRAEVEIAPLKLIYIAFFIFMVCLLFKQRHSFFRPHTRYLSSEDAEKRKHLVLFLSNLRKELEDTNGIPKGLELSGHITKDLRTIEAFKKSDRGKQWSWEMPLRAINYHYGPLETVNLICSKESLFQLNLFKNICGRYDQFKDITFYVLAKKSGHSELISLSSPNDMGGYEGFDFESFDELSSAMWLLLRKFKKKGYPEHEIMIDITGGQKPTSIVGASLTFNRKIKAQYIQTNTPYKALSYDVILAPADTGSFGI